MFEATEEEKGPVVLSAGSPVPLKHPTLFSQANHVDGKWVDAGNGQTIVVKNPATGEGIGIPVFRRRQ